MTVDEIEARMRWETANADGKNAGFDPAVPLFKFKALDRAAAVARALPLVTAAHRWQLPPKNLGDGSQKHDYYLFYFYCDYSLIFIYGVFLVQHEGCPVSTSTVHAPRWWWLSNTSLQLDKAMYQNNREWTKCCMHCAVSCQPCKVTI